jgi:HPt (histidine-containing phosphotransfer) domain-containing protein
MENRHQTMSSVEKRPSWNPSAALESVGGDEILLSEVIQAFLEESPRLVDQIDQALSLPDRRLLELAAHNLTGGLGYLGVPEAHEAAQRLETAGRDGEIENARELFVDLRSRLVALWAGLAKYAGV